MSQEGRHARFAHGSRSIVHQLGTPPVHQSTDEETTSNRKRPKQVCGEIQIGVTQSRSAYILVSLSPKPALYNPVVLRKAHPAESSTGESSNKPRTFLPGNRSPGESSNQPRTYLPGNRSHGENPDQSCIFCLGNTQNHVLANPDV